MSLPDLITAKQYHKDVADSLDYYIGQYTGDVYLTALNMYSRLTYPAQAQMFFRDDLDIVAGGANPDGLVGVWMGTQPGTLTDRMRSRVNERLGLTTGKQIDEVYMPFVVAHELGHCVQSDPQFEQIFGRRVNDFVNLDEDYEGYATSHNETNADYIAASIIGNSLIGKLIDYMPPVEAPLEWRSWIERHPIPQTIAM